MTYLPVNEKQYPVPENEMERIISLSELDLDYASLSENFKDLTHLAAKVAGTDISLVNLIDSFTQWTVGRHGLEIDQMTREESACQYTIMGDDHFEVKDLSADERFKENFYVKDPLSLRYYFGVPLKNNDGANLGALCVLDTQLKSLTPEKVELLKIIANEIVNRLNVHKVIDSLRTKVKDANESKKKVAHDIRGPLAGIIGLSEIIAEQGSSVKLEEVLEFINLINRSSKSVLELADEILTEESAVRNLKENQFNLNVFAEKLQKLYAPQAVNKGVQLDIELMKGAEHIPFSRNKLLQIAGNLISNAIKFTGKNGRVHVVLNLIVQSHQNILSISVSDSGTGMNQEMIDNIMSGGAKSTAGTSGEKGYGFGLSLVSHLINGLGGSLSINSAPGQGTTFLVLIPQNNV
ncbi:GAF domain-containing sensor histidine kinase [Pedobacter deserti]|uniref:GAF domain-containing sensor histidine kinase n=1 Tax=Pedobacter deserti TaxID=2817382 RepID=UPI00210CFA65|nr:GAF domain-containing sensor histidine kinase [Pedobacter sp. SYSU D00382]